MSDPHSLITIHKGTCHLYYAYDIGISLNLPSCHSRMLAAGRCSVSDRYRKAPKYFDVEPQPLTILQESAPLGFGRFTALGTVSLTFYEFGVVSVGYRIPFNKNFGELRALSIEVEKNETILVDSRNRMTATMKTLGEAIDNPLLAKRVEDYAIFEIYDFTVTVPLAKLVVDAGLPLAQILRAELQPLSGQEISDCLMHCISYGQEDITIIDWNASLIVSRDADDIRQVLEFANVELLEMRVLDGQLDDSLDKSYYLTYKIPDVVRYIPGRTTRIQRRISRMQLESAILLERVSNAPKLLGDQFLARVYRLAALRFHLGEWNATIQRKLETIEDFYEQIRNDTSSFRLEMLDLIIIILIAIEIIIPFIPRFLP
jgi:hypothetical protein